MQLINGIKICFTSWCWKVLELITLVNVIFTLWSVCLLQFWEFLWLHIFFERCHKCGKFFEDSLRLSKKVWSQKKMVWQNYFNQYLCIKFIPGFSKSIYYFKNVFFVLCVTKTNQRSNIIQVTKNFLNTFAWKLKFYFLFNTHLSLQNMDSFFILLEVNLCKYHNFCLCELLCVFTISGFY